jgi:hypothetical protein
MVEEKRKIPLKVITSPQKMNISSEINMSNVVYKVYKVVAISQILLKEELL